ncbi:MAG: selenium-dependent molybdenum cofactor biosynthesis protein YqeB [Bellilinea sp.]
MVIRGGGDLGSGVGVRLHRAGVIVLVCELPKPLVVRRYVSFAEAVFSGETMVEEVRAKKISNRTEISRYIQENVVPVLIDPAAECLTWFDADVLVDCRLRKSPPDLGLNAARMVIGLGPGFIAGVNCHAVVETKRGATLGRVYWRGTSEADTRMPEAVYGYVEERVLRAPCAGIFKSLVGICDFVSQGQVVGQVEDSHILASCDGVVRGLVVDGLEVEAGMKVGDIDPRNDLRLCSLVSDKALAVGGGVLEAILSNPDMRRRLCDTQA